MNIMEERHSVRQYEDKAIEPEKHAVLDEIAAKANAEAGLHIQISYDEPDCFASIRAGSFSGVSNYISLIGKKSQELDKMLGYYGEMLVLKAQELGLNTCWVALTHGKSKAEVLSGEKCVCLIALGYGKTQGVAHKSKPVETLCNYSDALPDWFVAGMEAALLAPTAMNQQKFYFELLPDGKVKASCGKGFYTKLDLGIVKYHFELGSERKID